MTKAKEDNTEAIRSEMDAIRAEFDGLKRKALEFYQIIEKAKAKVIRFRKELGSIKRLPMEAMIQFDGLEAALGIERDGAEFLKDIQERLDLDPQTGDMKTIEDPASVAELNRIDRQFKSPKTTLRPASLGLARLSASHPSLSDQLRAMIKDQGWSLTALGELAKVDPGVLSRFMNGDSAMTSDTLDRLGKALLLRVFSEDFLTFKQAIVTDRRKKKK